MPDRVAFEIFGIPVYWYGIMIMLGVIVASYVAYREARRRGEDPDHVWNLFPWALIGGVLGARIAWVIASLGERQFTSILDVIDIRQGGLSMHGVIIGGVLAVLLYCWRYKLSPFKWFDIIMPGVAIAQAIGRLGNYFNQEAFGAPTNLPWGIPISVERQREVAGQNFGPDARFHPTFAYEMIWNFINFGLLMWLGRQKRIRLREGDIMWVYLIFYSIGRYAIEELRVDSAMAGGLKIPQLVSIITIVFAWTMLIYRHRPGTTAPLSEANLLVGEARTGAVAGATRAGAASPRGLRTSRLRRVPSFTSPNGAKADSRVTSAPAQATEASQTSE